MGVSALKLFCLTIIIILIGYHFQAGECSSTPTHRGVREWRRNTNFGNANNWENLQDVNCSSNIFSFPGWMDTTVVSWPSFFIGKQIILPTNGHFVFQPGVTTISDQGKSDGSCQRAREVKFTRTSRMNWFDPNNWNVTSSEQASGLNAIPHVERVPCQFDEAKFPIRSTFSVLIPQTVALGKFLLGEEVISYTNIAIMMTSPMGKLQWEKKPESDFNLTNAECKDDDDSCICDNYNAAVKQKICSLAQPLCRSIDEEECPNPLLPHGFCCPICGFHIKIKHSGSLKLGPIANRLKSLSPSSSNNALGVDYFVSRYSQRNAHIILAPVTKDAIDSGLNILGGIMAFLKLQPQVEDVSWTGSWAHVASDVDKWTSQGISGATITFLVMLGITVILGILCFIYYKKNGSYPPMTLSTISSLFPSNLSMPTIRMPSMTMPNININLPGRRGSTQAGGRTFGFARFSNERVSTVNIERSAAAVADGDTTVERGESVDDAIQLIDSASLIAEEKVTQVSSDVGFTNVTYDLVGVDDSSKLHQQHGIEMVDTTNNCGTLSSSADIGMSPPPPKPIRIGTGTLELRQLSGSGEPVYNEVLDALSDDQSATLIPDVDEE